MFNSTKFSVFAGLLCVAAHANATIVAWGDSFVSGSGGTPFTTPLALLTGAQVLNQGVGGETSTQVKDRMLAAPQFFGDFNVLWAGRNNYASPATVQTDIASMVGAVTSGQFLVLSIMNGSYGGYEIAGGQGWQWITGINSALASTYGNRYLDVRSILVASYDPANAQDMIDFANDTVPGSLRSDAIHLNTLGNELVAQAVYARYEQLLLAVPEPGTLALFALGAALLLVGRRPAHRRA